MENNLTQYQNSQKNLILVETLDIALPYMVPVKAKPHYLQNVFHYESDETETKRFLSPGDILEEGDIIQSRPSGVVLEHRHGQLVIYEETQDNDQSSGSASQSNINILWQTQPYLDDGSSIRSMFHFGPDCNIIIYSDTIQRRQEWLSEESALWQSWTWLDNSDACFFGWDPLLRKPFVQGLQGGNSTSKNSTRKTIFIDDINSWEPRHLTTKSKGKELALILPAWTKVMQGFMIESNPPGLVLQHANGKLYLYDNNPANNSNASLLWYSEGAYTYTGDSDLTWSMFREYNLVIRVPHGPHFDDAPWLWRTHVMASEGAQDNCFGGSCFLAWIPGEERLAIYKGSIDSPGFEVWTSKHFAWEPCHGELSVAKQEAVMILTRSSSAFSILGSVVIIAIIISRFIRCKKTVNTRDRLIFCMSFLDFLSSIAHFLDVTPIPRNTYGIQGAIGTQATCTAQGFFIQLGFAVPLYNCMVCLYVLSVVCFKCKEHFIVTRVEPLMHILVWGYALGTGFLGIILELYNSNGTFCWVEQYPHDCSDMDHVKCERGKDAYFYQWMFAGVTLILAFVVIVASMSWLYCYIRSNKMKMIARFGPAAASNNRQLHEVGKQAFLYVAAFMITFVWPMVINIQRHYWVTPPIWELACFSFFFPLQGFWNFGIYIRPMYNRVCRQNPERSFFWKLRTAIVREATKKKQTQAPRRTTTDVNQSSTRIRSGQFNIWSSPWFQSTPTPENVAIVSSSGLCVDQRKVETEYIRSNFDQKQVKFEKEDPKIHELSCVAVQPRRRNSLECILGNVPDQPRKAQAIHIEDDEYLISNPTRRSSRRRDLDIDIVQVQKQLNLADRSDLENACCTSHRNSTSHDVDIAVEQFQEKLEQDQVLADCVEAMVSGGEAKRGIGVDGDRNSNTLAKTPTEEECGSQCISAKEEDEESHSIHAEDDDTTHYYDIHGDLLQGEMELNAVFCDYEQFLRDLEDGDLESGSKSSKRVVGNFQ